MLRRLKPRASHFPFPCETLSPVLVYGDTMSDLHALQAAPDRFPLHRACEGREEVPGHPAPNFSAQKGERALLPVGLPGQWGQELCLSQSAGSRPAPLPVRHLPPHSQPAVQGWGGVTEMRDTGGSAWLQLVSVTRGASAPGL